MTENRMQNVIDAIDSYDYYVKDKVARDTEENRKGQFALTFTDAEGHPLDKVRYVVRQKTHAFNFGATTFYLGGFDDDARNRLYEDRFTGLFNYAVLPMYWDTLEPEQGKPRFEEGCVHIDRRPPFDRSVAFCRKNHLRMKGHCLVYNSFQPDWIPEDTRQLKILIEKRVAEIAARYGDAFEDMDVINEMISIYKNAYPGNGMRNLSITDEPDHEKWAFTLAEKYFPHTRLFWNEGGYETFGSPQYVGFRSFFYMALKENLAKGAPIGGIGMQYHCYAQPQNVDTKLAYLANPLRILDVLERYGDFGLPIHISEVNVPSWSNDPEDEALQAELVKRLYRLWFSQKHVAGVVWWNLADGTALNIENHYHGGLIRNDCTPKPAYRALDELINREWRTELCGEADKRLNFRGFYGDYEVEAVCGDLRAAVTLRLFADNTGYDNRLCDFRSKRIVLRPGQ